MHGVFREAVKERAQLLPVLRPLRISEREEGVSKGFLIMLKHRAIRILSQIRELHDRERNTSSLGFGQAIDHKNRFLHHSAQQQLVVHLQRVNEREFLLEQLIYDDYHSRQILSHYQILNLGQVDESEPTKLHSQKIEAFHQG